MKKKQIILYSLIMIISGAVIIDLTYLTFLGGALITLGVMGILVMPMLVDDF
jgi:hypothetical protein